VLVQLVEIPGLIEGASSGRGGARPLLGVLRGADAILWNDHVADGVGLRVEDPEIRRVQPAAAVGAEAGILRHLEPQVFPATQGRREGSASALGALPVMLCPL